MAAQRSSASSRKREFAATPPAINKRRHPELGGGADRLARQHVGHRLLEARRHIGLRRVGVTFHVSRDGGLQPGEAERIRVVAWPGHAAREDDRVPVALAGQVVEHLAAGIPEAQQPRHLVVGLTGGIVDGAAELDDRFAQ